MNLLICIFLIMILLFAVLIIIYVYKNRQNFFENPYLYAANHMAGGGEVYCTCEHFKPGLDNPLYFQFNNTHWEAIPQSKALYFYD